MKPITEGGDISQMEMYWRRQWAYDVIVDGDGGLEVMGMVGMRDYGDDGDERGVLVAMVERIEE